LILGKFNGKCKSASLRELPIIVRVREWPVGHTNAGCWPVPIKDLNIRTLDKYIKGKARIRIKPFPGGLRVPHFHIDDDVVFVTHEEFKEAVGEIAKELAGNLALKAEYIDTVGAIRGLVPGSK
jgi:hypothetical protein